MVSYPRCHSRGSGHPSLFKGSLDFRNFLQETHAKPAKIVEGLKEGYLFMQVFSFLTETESLSGKWRDTFSLSFREYWTDLEMSVFRP